MGVRDEQVLFAMSKDSFEEDLEFLARVLVALFFSAIVATALAARWLGASLSRDVDAIATVARTVARGQLSARVGPGRRGSDETAALADDLDHMVAQLDELVSTQQRFISHAAHELRSPLATLRGELQLALRRPRQLVEYQETIEEALEEVTALCSLAEDLLTLARVQHRNHDEARTSLHEIIADAVRLTIAPAEDRGVRLMVPDVDRNIQVVGVRADLTRALRNLIDNAIAHSPKNSDVKISVDVDDNKLFLAVVDAGPGVSAEDADAIFAPFFRSARNQSSDSGAGLGLSITREIARAYGGDVVLDGSHRNGAKFLLSLVPA
ncbi:MAG: HAMP domain-containing sensor histidine kinase [Polyangiaceae bacterium]